MSIEFKVFLASLCFAINIGSSYAQPNRTVGPPQDLEFQQISQACNGSDPNLYTYGMCSILIDCVYENVSTVMGQSLSIGGSIAGLLPTILAFIGCPPSELLQLAVFAPHRALTTCCFGIGLPLTLFRQLRSLRFHPDSSNPLQIRQRQWTMRLCTLSRKTLPTHLSLKLLADIIILTVTATMLWQNWMINSSIMVPWRCEYWWLVIAWPIACVTWLLLSITLLMLFKEEMIIYRTDAPSIRYTFCELITLPYTLNFRSHSENTKGTSLLPTINRTMTTIARGNTTDSNMSTETLTESIHGSLDANIEANEVYSITVQILMPTAFGIRSWQTLEAFMELVAVGIYFYATFVLMSALFLKAARAIEFATIMGLCLSTVRVIELLF